MYELKNRKKPYPYAHIAACRKEKGVLKSDRRAFRFVFKRRYLSLSSNTSSHFLYLYQVYTALWLKSSLADRRKQVSPNPNPSNVVSISEAAFCAILQQRLENMEYLRFPIRTSHCVSMGLLVVQKPTRNTINLYYKIYIAV